MKHRTRLLCRTALLLALCIAAQFFKNVSVYITGPIINTMLILATLSCGLWSGAALAVLTPLTSWLITGSPIMNAFPLIAPCIMLGNCLLVLFVWGFGMRLARRLPPMPPMSVHDGRFRAGWLIALVAAVLCSGIGVTFLASFGELLHVSVMAMIAVLLATAAGCLVLFAGLWMLAAKMPRTWTLAAGLVFGSAAKAAFLWLTVSRGLLCAETTLAEAAVAVAKTTFSVTQLLTALLGSVLAFLVWLPLSHVIRPDDGACADCGGMEPERPPHPRKREGGR